MGHGMKVLMLAALLAGLATANGAPPTSSSLTVSVAGSGAVTSSPSGIVCPSDCDEAFVKGTRVTLTASPATGQTFVGWGGACAGTSTTCSIKVSAPLTTVTAEFTEATARYPAPVATTGQTTSYGPGDDGALQVGIPSPNPRFTDNSDGTANDSLTGLTWKIDGGQFANYWSDALETCNSYSGGGLTDWRLPNFRELLSIMDFGRRSPMLPAGHPFTNLVIDGGASFYWSSTSNAYYGLPGDYMYAIAMDTGRIDYQRSKYSGGYVLCVRGGV